MTIHVDYDERALILTIKAGKSPGEDFDDAEARRLMKHILDSLYRHLIKGGFTRTDHEYATMLDEFEALANTALADEEDTP